ncbi:hypothetical protein PMIN01_13477 [Paraphaeosphaeria minitans]|nr:hypothetical protein PMIN01_13477 [Paraphaeosphaeria minitans]
MTYIRKGYHLRLQTRESLNHPDLLWVVVNGVAILNCYRQPLTPDVLQYVTHLTPPQHCLVGGDFNVRHESFEPAVTAANGGIELARWAAAASMDYIGVPGQPTHCAGHVLDLTFSNIPFAQSAVEASMHSGSDHETIVTSIPTSALGTPHLAQYHYRVPEASLPKFAGLIEIGVQGIPDPLAAQDTAQLDNCVSLLTETIQQSVRTAGRPDRKEGRAAPWWTEECKTAYQAYKRARQLYLGSPPSEETRAFKTIVRQAKRQYWRHVIDNAKDDKDLFKDHLRTTSQLSPQGYHCLRIPVPSAWDRVLVQGPHQTAANTQAWQTARAARGILPVWRTTPTATLFRDAGLPSAAVALEEAKLRYATHLRAIDSDHLLTNRAVVPIVNRGKGAGKPQRIQTKVQQLGSLLPEIPRTELIAPHYSPGCRTDPTLGIDKKTAAKSFKEWWAQLPPLDVTIFSDGSEQYTKEGEKRVTYGYAVYQNGRQLQSGRGSLHPTSHVFDAEVVGAWRGLQHTIRQPALSTRRIWMCVDSTSVIWGLRGVAPSTSQWAFLACHGAMETHDVSIKWAPGHLGIEGNETADRLANQEAQHPSPPTGKAAVPTLSGIKSVARKVLRSIQQIWWADKKTKLSRWYKSWELDYAPRRGPGELDLPRAVLARFLSIRSMHGDFAWYHRKFNHNDANLTCSCGRDKTPEHLALCRKTLGAFGRWPLRPPALPSSRADGLAYTAALIGDPEAFEAFTQLTQYYTKVCPR